MRTKNKYTANLAADKKEANGFNGVVDGGLLWKCPPSLVKTHHLQLCVCHSCQCRLCSGASSGRVERPKRERGEADSEKKG